MWLDGDTESLIKRNIVHRYGNESLGYNEVRFGGKSESVSNITSGLTLIRFPDVTSFQRKDIYQYIPAIAEFAGQYSEQNEPNNYLVIEVKDIRYRKQLIPLGLFVFEELFNQNNLTLKEIIVVAPIGTNSPGSQDELNIVHKYLFVFVKE